MDADRAAWAALREETDRAAEPMPDDIPALFARWQDAADAAGPAGDLTTLLARNDSEALTLHEWPREARGAWLQASDSGDAHRPPDLWHGLDMTRPDVADVYSRRVKAAHGARTRPLAPGYSHDDLKVEAHGQPLQDRDSRRFRLLLDSLADRHVDHWYYSAPFCWNCHGAQVAGARLFRWLVLNPGKDPRALERIRATVPGDEPEPVEAAEARSPFLTLDALLAQQPAEMLVEEILPSASYGLLTGRDQTLKSFLALDLALHLATGGGAWYGGRWAEPVNYARALYVVGEGVSSFGNRAVAWLNEHGIDPARVPGDALTLRNGTVDLHKGGPGFDALLAEVERLEPDLVVIDTLARSVGGADQNNPGEMAAALRRIDALKVAANGGTVLVVAHTTKKNEDTRGASNIEDDADFVLKVGYDRPSMRQTVAVEKMKDGESGQSFVLQAVKVPVGPEPEPGEQDDRDTTLVLRDPQASALTFIPAEDATTRDRIHAALAECPEPLTVAKIADYIQWDGKSLSGVYKALGVLVDRGRALKIKRGAGYVYTAVVGE